MPRFEHKMIQLDERCLITLDIDFEALRYIAIGYGGLIYHLERLFTGKPVPISELEYYSIKVVCIEPIKRAELMLDSSLWNVPNGEPTDQ